MKITSGKNGFSLMELMIVLAIVAILVALALPSYTRYVLKANRGEAQQLLLNWSNKADMMRISGVGPQFAELLEASGVDTIKELRQRNAENLATKMSEVNSEKNLAKSSPATSLIEEWIAQAKKLDPTISH